MAWASTSGLPGISIKGNTNSIEGMAMEKCTGLIPQFTRDIGGKAFSTGMV